MRCNLIFFILLFFITASINANAQVTGEVITGKASAQQVGMNISVVSTLPTLTIISPKNKTYINEWVLLNYTTTNAQSIWYKLDNSPNITINFPFYFNVSEGSHTLYLHANNSAGTNITNITFTINLTIFIINYSKWQGAYMGDSTNFSRYSYEEMQNLSNIIFEHISYGKMFFYEEINFTHDANSSDNFLDFNSYTNISFNRIELNSSALPNFNRSATLRLYNLTLINPRIARDGFVCPSNICVIESYSNSVLVFNVTGFSVYGAEETPSGGGNSGGSSGGGGAGFKKDFSLNKEKIQISLKQGETKQEKVEIKNTGEAQLSITLSTELEDFLKISEPVFELEAGKAKVISLDIIARENILPDLYIGKLFVRGEGIEKEILISVEVESENPLFKIRMEIPKGFLQVTPGKNIPVAIKIWREGEGEANVEIEYSIKSDMAEIIFNEQETRTVETQTSFTKEIKITKDIKPGNYFLYGKVTYNTKTASSSAWFLVKKTLLNKENLIYLVILISIIIIILMRAIKRAGNRHEK